jgi:hypothetical protein
MASWLNLKLRGIDIQARKEANLMNTVTVAEAMIPEEDMMTVQVDTSLSRISPALP